MEYPPLLAGIFSNGSNMLPVFLHESLVCQLALVSLGLDLFHLVDDDIELLKMILVDLRGRPPPHASSTKPPRGTGQGRLRTLRS